jgi:CubicO group peptidase (beta-lactamase class C family)
MKAEDIVAAATQDWARSDAAGGAIALFEGGRVTRGWCIGLADIESRRGWTLDTPTRLASLSKHVTAAAVFAHGLDTARSLGSWLPELEGAVAASTLGRALTMTSGIPDLAETLGLAGVPGSPPFDAERLHRLSCRITHLNFAPGEEVSYSNTGFRLAQRVVERAGGCDLAAWLAGEVFAPLGLSSFALVEDQSVVVPGLASGYWHADGQPRRGQYGLHYSGSGGMVASVADMVRWVDALLSGRGPLAGLQARLVEPGRLATGASVGYAHGLMLHRIGTTDLVGHGGSLPGYKNHFVVDPRTGRGAIVMSNREETQAQALALALLAAELGIAHAPQTPAACPVGAFVDAATGDVLELAAGPSGPTANFLGSEERIFVGEDGVWASAAPHFPIRIRPAAVDAEALQASVGGAAERTWLRADGAAWPVRPGLYRCAELDATHEIAIADGASYVRWGHCAAPAAWQPLRPLRDGSHATATPPNGPWRQRPVLRFAEESFVLSSNRSRRWRFARV